MTRTAFPLLLALVATPAWAGIPAEQEDCLGCHSDPAQTFDLPSGEKLSLYVDQKAFAQSVHGEALRCTECHTDKTSDHATGQLKFKTRREVTRAYYEQCKGCHFAGPGGVPARVARGRRPAGLHHVPPQAVRHPGPLGRAPRPGRDPRGHGEG